MLKASSMRGEYSKNGPPQPRHQQRHNIFFVLSYPSVFFFLIPVLNRKVLGQFSQLYYVNDGKNPSQASSFRTKRKNVAARG